MGYRRGDKRDKATRANFKPPEAVPYTGDNRKFKLTPEAVRKIRSLYNRKKWPTSKIRYMLWKKMGIIVSLEAVHKAATRKTYKNLK